MKTVLIVEDNLKSMEMLKNIVRELNEGVSIKTATNQEEAYAMAMKYTIDLFMLDIILSPEIPGDVSGLELADMLRDTKKYEYTPIVFITSLEDPKMYAYSDIHCYYYLEKPYDVPKVSQILKEALSIPIVKREKQYVYFRKDGILYKKDISDIVFIENTRAGQVVNLVNGQIKLSYKPMSKILEELDSHNFVQCNRYVIVNKEYVEAVDITNRYIKLRGIKEPLELGMAYKKKFLKEFTNGKEY